MQILRETQTGLSESSSGLFRRFKSNYYSQVSNPLFPAIKITAWKNNEISKMWLEIINFLKILSWGYLKGKKILKS